uniref:Uncharacterized protein n=1 Tax=viral metagenome TaxID=1070528 RepID=A0A6C0J8N0_9ZZZZ
MYDNNILDKINELTKLLTKVDTYDKYELLSLKQSIINNYNIMYKLDKDIVKYIVVCQKLNNELYFKINLLLKHY